MDFNLTSLLFIMIAYVLALTLHEFAHALAGDWLGDRTARQEGRLTLNPLAHIDPVMTVLLPLALIVLHSPVIFGAARPVPFNPWALKYGKWGAALVAAAGPAMNLFLAIFFALWLRFVPISPDFLPLFVQIIELNIFFMVFNLIPFPPLDGSRIAYAALPPIRNLFDKLERNGIMIVFAILFLAGPFITPVIGSISRSILEILIPGLTRL